ncbi:protein of unknown function (plasmid) [Cupriavidus taiwanensis]|nr:protein of unknown function [Cupriavidus taiwanensis]
MRCQGWPQDLAYKATHPALCFGLKLHLPDILDGPSLVKAPKCEIHATA